MLGRLGLGLLIAVAQASPAGAQSSIRFDGQYTGELVLKRVISGDCTEPPLGALYPLTISKGEVRFAYLPKFATILRGRIDENGVFRASARSRKGQVKMIGHVQGNQVSASIESPSCNYTFQSRN